MMLLFIVGRAPADEMRCAVLVLGENCLGTGRIASLPAEQRKLAGNTELGRHWGDTAAREMSTSSPASSVSRVDGSAAKAPQHEKGGRNMAFRTKSTDITHEVDRLASALDGSSTTSNLLMSTFMCHT